MNSPNHSIVNIEHSACIDSVSHSDGQTECLFAHRRHVRGLGQRSIIYTLIHYWLAGWLADYQFSLLVLCWNDGDAVVVVYTVKANIFLYKYSMHSQSKLCFLWFVNSNGESTNKQAMLGQIIYLFLPVPSFHYSCLVIDILLRRRTNQCQGMHSCFCVIESCCRWWRQPMFLGIEQFTLNNINTSPESCKPLMECNRRELINQLFIQNQIWKIFPNFLTECDVVNPMFSFHFKLSVSFGSSILKLDSCRLFSLEFNFLKAHEQFVCSNLINVFIPCQTCSLCYARILQARKVNIEKGCFGWMDSVRVPLLGKFKCLWKKLILQSNLPGSIQWMQIFVLGLAKFFLYILNPRFRLPAMEKWNESWKKYCSPIPSTRESCIVLLFLFDVCHCKYMIIFGNILSGLSRSFCFIGNGHEVWQASMKSICYRFTRT